MSYTGSTPLPITAEITQADQLVQVALASYSHFGSLPWFRGSADAQWSLLPSLFRTRPDGWSPGDPLVYERTLVNDFVRFAPSRRERLPPLSDYAAWLCLMRHYGLPTRVLDWTTSVFVAAYFAVSEIADGPADLWALHICRLNQLAVGRYEHLSMRSDHEIVSKLVNRPFRDTEVPQTAVAVIAPEVDARLLAQQGGFTLHGCTVPLNRFPEAPTFLLRFRIPASAKKRLGWQLELLGFTRMNLFPDLGNLAATLAGWRYGPPEV